MDSALLPAPGDLIGVADLRLPNARESVDLLSAGRIPFVTLIECRVQMVPLYAEAVVCDVEVELPQRPVNPIQKVERIVVTFYEVDVLLPETSALRADFPEVPHLNIKYEELPRSLCLSDRPYSELKLSWSPAWHFRSIREWLAQTAEGTLHGRDQRLEPLLPPSPWTLVLPLPLLSSEPAAALGSFVLTAVDGGNDRMLIQPVDAGAPTQATVKFEVAAFVAKPQQHGVIRRVPRNLRELHALLEPGGDDLLSALQTQMKTWKDGGTDLAHEVILLVGVPKTRQEGGDVEEMETFAFVLCLPPADAVPVEYRDPNQRSLITIKEIGRRIGCWELLDGRIAHLLGAMPDESASVGVALLNTTFPFTRERAAKAAGCGLRSGPKVAGVGIGALGSQLVVDLIRSGFGEWMLIDSDVILPHNLARHALFGNAMGVPKSLAVAVTVNSTVAGPPVAQHVVADVLMPGSERDSVEVALAGAEIILDASASVPVARYLALDARSDARRMSAFLNPSGTDLVVLAEDRNRAARLDWLEMQYYRAVASIGCLAGHLADATGQVRYGQSCRDVSSTISQEHVGLHAAIASRAVRESSTSDSATVSIWRTDAYLAVERYAEQGTPVVEVEAAGWTVCTDQRFLDTVARLREAKLPAETGGIILGSVDRHRKVVYAVDTIPAPTDSCEGTASFVRGIRGLGAAVDAAFRETAGSLGYVGEWHSHPDGFSTRPSPDDRHLFLWLDELMRPDSLVAVMMIAGQHDAAWFVDRIS